MQDDKLNNASDPSEEMKHTLADDNFDLLDRDDDEPSGGGDDEIDALLADLINEARADRSESAAKVGPSDTKKEAVGAKTAVSAKTASGAKAAAGAKTADVSKTAGAAAKKSGAAFRENEARNAAQSISELLGAGRLSQALDKTLSVDEEIREAVKSNISVKIPLGSRDSDLRQIAAGALIQSYLDCGNIDRDDLEDKLFAIIESSEPEYDENDEIVEQTKDDVLYKVTACEVFAAELVEKSGSHPVQKRAMYGDDDSVLDACLFDNLTEVQKTNKKRLALLCGAVEASGGDVGEKFMLYYAEAKKANAPLIVKFFGDSPIFKIASAAIVALCLVSIGFYVFSASSIFSFVAKDSAIMLYVVMAEVFFIIGMALLCVIVGFGGKMKALKRAEKQQKSE